MSKELLANLAAATILHLSNPTTPDASLQTNIQPSEQGPLDPAQRNQSSRLKSELHDYIRTPEEHLQELADGLPGLVLVGGFITTIYFLRKFPR